MDKDNTDAGRQPETGYPNKIAVTTQVEVLLLFINADTGSGRARPVDAAAALNFGGYPGQLGDDHAPTPGQAAACHNKGAVP